MTDIIANNLEILEKLNKNCFRTFIFLVHNFYNINETSNLKETPHAKIWIFKP